MKTFRYVRNAARLSLLLVLAAALIIPLFGCAAEGGRDENGVSESAAQTEPPPTQDKNEKLACLYADSTEKLDKLCQNAEAVSGAEESCAVLLPHYANAFSMCCDALAGIRRDAELVVIAGPNHTGEGESIQISGADWYWSGGEAKGDAETAEKLALACGAACTSRVISQDWSVQSLIPYVRAYFPNARIVTVLLARGAREDALMALAESFAEIQTERELLLVGSADFSHYHDPETAAKNDEVTLSCIENGETARLLTLDNGYIDSPETAVLTMYYAGLQKAELKQSGGLFERFRENGQEKAGSYYAFYAQKEP